MKARAFEYSREERLRSSAEPSQRYRASQV